MPIESGPPKADLKTRLVAIPPFSRTKDSAYLPFLLGDVSRWVWRFVTHRLTQPGRWLIGVTLIFLMVGSNSLDVQFYVPFTYLFGLWLVAVVCIPLVKPRMELKAEHVDRVRVGELLAVEIEARQLRRLPFVRFAIVPHGLPPHIDAAAGEETPLPRLLPGQAARVRLLLRCKRRGFHSWRGFRVETEFPFGVLRSYRNYEQRRRVLVYPRFTPLVRMEIPIGRRYHPGGVALASNIGDSFEYMGNREYREGDNVRDIDWRATARLNTPIVREYREEYFMRVGVVLDTYVPAEGGRQARETFERAVSLCAAVSDYMARSDYIVDIFAAGPNLYHLTAGRSLAYLDQILDILACVDESPQEPFAVLEPEIVSYLSRITTLICVLMDWDETRRAFVERLRRDGAGVKVIVVRDRPCALDPEEADLAHAIPLLSTEQVDAGIEEL